MNDHNEINFKNSEFFQHKKYLLSVKTHWKLIAIISLIIVVSITLLTIARQLSSNSLTNSSRATESDSANIPFPTPSLYPCVTITPTPEHRIILEKPLPTAFVYTSPSPRPTPTFGPSPRRREGGGLNEPQPSITGTSIKMTPKPTRAPLPPCQY